MDRLILHPTDTSQWYALVNDAQDFTNLILSESTESYLVFLLMRFTQDSNLIESIVSMDFLHAINKPKHIQFDMLKNVGDKSLLFCGLFPGMAEKRRVNISYFIDLGQSAYLTLSELETAVDSELYYQLSDQFLDMQRILQAMRTTINHPM